MDILIIAAMDQARAIGRDGDLPWRLPKDLQRFKRLSMGKPIVFGRKTWASIGRPLPGRTNIILSRDPGFAAPGCLTARSLTAALQIARDQEAEAVTIGGGQSVYAEALEIATHMHLTQVHTTVQGADTWFPAWDASQWREVERSVALKDEKHPYDMTWIEYVRAA